MSSIHMAGNYISIYLLGSGALFRPPRFFNKLMKPVFSFPRELGHISSGYLDDSFSLTILPEERQANIDDTLTLNHDLGFLPYEVKSVTIYTNLGLASRRVYF